MEDGELKIKIIRARRKSFSMQFKGEGLEVRVPFFSSKSEIQAFISKNRGWIEKQLKRRAEEEAAPVRLLSEEELKALSRAAKRVIPEKVEAYARLIGVDYGTISYRFQKTRWGSCTKDGNLNFNCLLMLAPEHVLDSVIVHELCHRKEMNHSKAFYDEVLHIMPDYKNAHKWLKENGNRLMKMGGRK